MEVLDSDLQSQNPEDFQSDNEPPQDEILDQKLVYKSEMIRVYKQILKVGKLIDKPAKYDKVQIRIRNTQQEQQEQQEQKKEINKIHREYSQLLQEKVQEFNLGLNQNQEWFVENIVTNMKREEINLVIIQKLKLDSGVKVVDSQTFYQIQLIDYLTVIDLDMDFNYLKTIVRKGQGNQRVQSSDLIDLTLRLYYFTYSQSQSLLQSSLEQQQQQEQQQYEEQQQQLEKQQSQQSQQQCKLEITIFETKLNKQSLRDAVKDNNIKKIIEGMKNQEKSNSVIKIGSYIENLDNNIQYYNELQDLKNQQKVIEVYLDIDIEMVYEVDDLFSDGVFLKTVLVQGLYSDGPTNNSQVSINFMIIDQSQNLLYQTEYFHKNTLQKAIDFYKSNSHFIQQRDKQNKIKHLKKYAEDQNYDDDNIDKEKENENKFDKSNGLVFFLDEFFISKLLKVCLNTMKRGEICEMVINNKGEGSEFETNKQKIQKRLNYGLDYELIIKNKSIKDLDYIKYIIILDGFSEGKNAFNMSIDEKIFNAKRKKEIGVKMIEKKEYKKALKVLQNTNSLFELGIDEKDKSKINTIMSQCLMNTSLVLMKQLKHQECIRILKKVLEISGQKNPKAIYRLSHCYWQLGEYNEALEYIRNNIDYQEESALIALEQNIIKEQDNYNQKQKKMYANMFQ